MCTVEQAAEGIVDEPPPKPPPKRTRTLADTPIWERRWTGQTERREVDARGRKRPPAKTKITKKDGVGGAGLEVVAPDFRAKDILLKVFALSHGEALHGAIAWCHTLLPRKLFFGVALLTSQDPRCWHGTHHHAHSGIRPILGQTLFKAINSYLARPGAPLLTAEQAKARFTQINASKFPLVPFTQIPGHHACCTRLQAVFLGGGGGGGGGVGGGGGGGGREQCSRLCCVLVGTRLGRMGLARNTVCSQQQLSTGGHVMVLAHHYVRAQRKILRVLPPS